MELEKMVADVWTSVGRHPFAYSAGALAVYVALKNYDKVLLYIAKDILKMGDHNRHLE